MESMPDDRVSSSLEKQHQQLRNYLNIPHHSEGKRASMMGSEFLGKRRLSSLNGDWPWKRNRIGSEFLGKRAAKGMGSEFLGKRMIIGNSRDSHDEEENLTKEEVD
jgi:hypothetical protein